MDLILQVFVIFAAAKAAGELCVRLAIPAIVGELLVGVGLGPHALGWVHVNQGTTVLSDLGIVIHERHFTLYEGAFWQHYGTTQPVYVRTREGVPLVTAYRRPGAP